MPWGQDIDFAWGNFPCLTQTHQLLGYLSQQPCVFSVCLIVCLSPTVSISLSDCLSLPLSRSLFPVLVSHPVSLSVVLM